MPRTSVCKTADLEVGRLLPASVGRTPVVVTRLPSGEIRAFYGRCPHQGAALSGGCVVGRVDGGDVHSLCVGRPGEVIRCPWHGFEWDLVDGLPLAPEPGAGPMRLRFYETAVDGDDVVVLT
jgi:nitrite reductase (NADH) small subunit